MMIMLLILCSYTLSLKVYTKNGLMNAVKNKDEGGSSSSSGTDKFVTSADYISKCMKGLTESIPPGFCWKKGGDAGILPSGCPSGYFRSMALCYELCPDGWSHVLGICYRNCDAGFTDLGLSCWRHIFDFYFKSSYIPKSLTNFADEIPCPSGFYKSGALCYRDCANIGMDNCGIGACITTDGDCTTEILKIANGVVEGVNTALWTILTMGGSNVPKAAAKVTAGTAVKSATKSGLKAGLKSVFNALKGPFKNFTMKKAKEKAKEFFKDQLTDKITEVTVSTVCGTIYNSIAAKEYTPPSDEEIGTKILESVDIFGIKDIVEGCTDVSDGGAACGRSIVSSLSTFDPTGILSIAAVFIHPTCDVPSVKPPADTIADFEADTALQTKLLAEKTERLKYVSSNTPSICIWIFDEVNFQGNKLEFCYNSMKDSTGSKDLTGTIFDNKVASFSVGDRVNGYFYEGANYTGKFVKFTKSTCVDDVSKFTYGSVNLKDTISSIWLGNEDIATFNARKEEEAAVLARLLAAKQSRFKDIQAATPAKCIWVYDQVDLLGTKLEVCQTTDLSKTTWNDKIVSYSVGAEVNGYLYENPYYSGKSIKLLKGTVIDNLGKFSVSGVNLKNIISSVYFGEEDYLTMKKRELVANTPAKCIWVYDQINYQGNRLQICSTRDLDGTDFNNKIASFSTGKDVDCYFFEGSKYMGWFLKFTSATMIDNVFDYTQDHVKLKSISSIWFGKEDIVQVYRSDKYKYNYFLTAANDYYYDFKIQTTKYNSYFLQFYIYSGRKIKCVFRDNGPVGLVSYFDKTQVLLSQDWPKPEVVYCSQNPPA
jgi:hypothetical protein